MRSLVWTRTVNSLVLLSTYFPTALFNNVKIIVYNIDYKN